MCGIIGIVDRRGFALSEIAEGLRKASHRGPDGEGFALWQSSDTPTAWIRARTLPTLPDHGGWVGLGHRRLAILDLSDDGLQPATSGNQKLWLVFNGEVY